MKLYSFIFRVKSMNRSEFIIHTHTKKKKEKNENVRITIINKNTTIQKLQVTSR